MTTTKRLIAASAAFVAVALMAWFCAAAGGFHWGTDDACVVALMGCVVGTALFGIIFISMSDL